MFSTPEQLGYDPNVTLDTTADHRYIFTIPMLPGDTLNAQSRRFRTVETISEYRLNNITGRMTRILLVKELDTGKKDPPRFVLKDIWLDKEAQTERELQSAIFYDIRGFWQGRSPESDSLSLKLFKDLHATLVSTGEYKNYFLDIVADYRGMVSPDPPIDAVSTRGLLDARYSVNPANLKVYPTPVPPPPRAYRDQQKLQYRVLFREFCTALGDLGTIGEVVDVLQQILTPLQLLLCAGWVHRDISAGNILAHGSDDHESASGQWQAKLADLEYATRFPPPAGYVPDAADHQIDPSERIVTSPDNEDEFDMATITCEYFRPSPAKKHTANPLAIHNFQHDLESIWWLLLWSITCRVRYLPSQIWGRYRFRTSGSGRLSKVRSDCFLYEMDESLYEALEPSVKVLARLMNDMRFKMRHALEMRQRAGRVNAVPAYAVIHARFYGWFEYIQHRLPEIAWRDVPLGNGVMELEQFEETCAANPTVEYSSVPTIGSPRDSTSAPASDSGAPIYQERLEDLDMPAA
ncbi:hypothetical protein JR316_0002662 [Psilocybe cubensis]|uniref:Uncharacterized protein n=1 Tax=Psilocybe cubensis TaxID=181762 RepID=A0ACB8HDG6_PSICU|nr:hypothetical protein JR316_0002662 [Psilocybe cubensis]KAH9485747.1 hypothetical protein JR316_0002662 [Psilocybe cubensis]